MSAVPAPKRASNFAESPEPMIAWSALAASAGSANVSDVVALEQPSASSASAVHAAVPRMERCWMVFMSGAPMT
jgi:hypothetical protein